MPTQRLSSTLSSIALGDGEFVLMAARLLAPVVDMAQRKSASCRSMSWAWWARLTTLAAAPADPSQQGLPWPCLLQQAQGAAPPFRWWGRAGSPAPRSVLSRAWTVIEHPGASWGWPDELMDPWP